MLIPEQIARHKEETRHMETIDKRTQHIGATGMSNNHQDNTYAFYYIYILISHTSEIN